MLYRHKRRFQAILQAALRLASVRESLDQISKASQLKQSKSSLGRLSSAKIGSSLKDNASRENLEDIDKLGATYLSYGSASSLWRYLDDCGYIQAAIDENDVDRRSLYGSREVANALMSFFNVKDVDTKNTEVDELCTDFFCYKRSFQREGFMVKSAVSFQKTSETLLFHEQQRSSSIYSFDRAMASESTIGFAMFKAGQLWIFGRETEHDEPRIFCFDSLRKSSDAAIGRDKVVGLYGWMMEGTQKSDNLSLFSSRVAMYTIEQDRLMWENSAGARRKPYQPDHHVDVIPYSPEALQKFGPLTDLRVPPVVLDYITSGTRPV